MKKVLLVVALLLLATPVFAADVTITATPVGAPVGTLQKVNIGYTGAAVSPATNAISAFALSLTVDLTADANIANIRDFKVGESNATSKGYGIFPAKFRTYIQVQNSTTADWEDTNYTPLAEWGDPNAGWGNNTKWIVTELGTLYQGDANAPASSGTLFAIDVNVKAGTDCNLCIALDQIRGGVVRKDTTAATVTLPPGGSGAPAGCIKIGSVGPPQVAVPNVVNMLPADANTAITNVSLTVAVRDYNWSATIAKGKTMAQTPAAGTLVDVGSSVKYTVSQGPTPAACFDPCTGATTQKTSYNGYITNKWDPNCWCNYPIGSGFQCHGDADGKATAAPNSYRIYTGDMTLVTGNWQKKAGAFPLGANPCADIDHKTTAAPNSYKVYTGDLARVTANWQRKGCTTMTGTLLPRNCPLNDTKNNATYVAPTSCADGK